MDNKIKHEEVGGSSQTQTLRTMLHILDDALTQMEQAQMGHEEQGDNQYPQNSDNTRKQHRHYILAVLNQFHLSIFHLF